jgi:hypothetical protein
MKNIKQNGKNNTTLLNYTLIYLKCGIANFNNAKLEKCI